MNLKEVYNLLLVVWCMAAEKPSWSIYDSDRAENRKLLAEHPLLAAVMFAAAGVCIGCVLALWGGILKLFMPEIGGAVLFAAAGVVLWEYIAGWKSSAGIVGAVQKRVITGCWSGDNDAGFAGNKVADISVGTLVFAGCIVVKFAGMVCIYLCGVGLIVVLAVFPFAVQGLMAHFESDGKMPLLAGGRTGQLYLLAAVLIVMFCGVAAAPAVIAAAVLVDWMVFELISRKSREVYGYVPLHCITLAGSIAEVSSMLAALILIG